MFRVIIFGSQNFDDYVLLESRCDKILERYKGSEIEIVTGKAKGADELGERYAVARGYSTKEFPADWAKHGKAAGMIRNREMGAYAHAAIGFWDGKSPGTKDMIEVAITNKMMVRVIRYK